MTSYSEAVLVRGMSFLAEKQAGIANNIANIDTSSFKRRVAIARESSHNFQSMLDREMPSVTFSEKADFARGILRETGNRLDVAVDGPSWLQVQNAGGEKFYTRNGQLQINKDGNLVTRDGMSLLDRTGNPIQVGLGGEAPTDLVISPNGQIQDAATGQQFGQINIVDLPNPELLSPIGRSLYRDPTAQAGTPAGSGLQQGFLEGSNVDTLQELVAMITVQRSFSATQKALTSASRLQENIITNILR